jgi:hypothetical protein
VAPADLAIPAERQENSSQLLRSSRHLDNEFHYHNVEWTWRRPASSWREVRDEFETE